MIAFITGEVADIEENLVVLDQQGIGYAVHVPSAVTGQLGIGEEMRLYTHMAVKEDSVTLYGFLNKDDLKTFRLLLGVSGIGPKGALAVLSTLSADDLRMAILSDDVKIISSVPGLGKKTAQKLILELKDKLDLNEVISEKLDRASSGNAAASTASSEAVMALTSLGYSGTSAMKAVRFVTETEEDLGTEEILKRALRIIQ